MCRYLERKIQKKFDFGGKKSVCEKFACFMLVLFCALDDDDVRKLSDLSFVGFFLFRFSLFD